VAVLAVAGLHEFRRCLARRRLGRHAFLVGLARRPGFRALPRRLPAVLLGVRLPVLSVDAGDPRASPNRKDFNIAAPVFESHQKNAGGNARIAETMFRYFRFPGRLRELRLPRQVQQGLAIKTAVTHWRSLKPHCMGTLYWQLNDTWPVAPGRRSTTAAAGNCCITWRGAFKGVNDRLETVSVDLEVFALCPSGKRRKLGSASGEAGTDRAQTLFEVAAKDLDDGEMLLWRWAATDGSNGEDLFAPKPFKAYDLVAPEIRLKKERDGDDWRLKLSAAKPAFFVAFEADCPGRFSDNAFTLLPGQDREIVFQPKDREASPSFILRDLHSATYGAS
jgi:beta-mannosidase